MLRGRNLIAARRLVELRQRTTYFAALITPDGDNFFGAFVSSVMFGYLVDRYGSYNLPFGGAAGGGAAAGCCAWAAPESVRLTAAMAASANLVMFPPGVV
jgi:hypothetical protein